MSIPVLMIGPGGDYVTRYEAQGTKLVRCAGHQSEGESSSAGSAGYGGGR